MIRLQNFSSENLDFTSRWWWYSNAWKVKLRLWKCSTCE